VAEQDLHRSKVPSLLVEIADLHPHQVAAAKLAVDRDVEQRTVTQSLLSF
jgi:hypothetical protein